MTGDGIIYSDGRDGLSPQHLSGIRHEAGTDGAPVRTVRVTIEHGIKLSRFNRAFG